MKKVLFIFLTLLFVTPLFAQMSSYKGTYQNSWRVDSLLLRSIYSSLDSLNILYILNNNDSSNANLVAGWGKFNERFVIGKIGRAHV